jgi:hypothetical protein
VQRYRREQKYYLALAELHAPASKERQEMFEKYRSAMFPYVIRTAVQHRDRTREILDEAFRSGPIVLRPDMRGVTGD